MANRNSQDSFIDKFLAIFGFRRPKKASKPAKRLEFDKPKKQVTSTSGKAVKKSVARKSVFSKKDDAPVLGDDFQIISTPKSNKKQNKTLATVGRVVLACFLIGIISFCLIVGAFMLYVFAFVDGTVEDDLNNLKLSYTSVLYANDPKTGKEVELTRLHGTENRLWVDIDEDMPEYLGKAFISAEDKRFESHEGVDWKRTFSAFANLIFKFWDTEQGGSTITQQLVKNITDDRETSAMRKVREIMRARYLEGHYTKEVILECYLNTIHLGPGVDGVEVAANYYFDKHAKDLTLTQAACLAAVTKSPSGYNPYEYPETNKNRRNWVLTEMYNNGYITKEECEAAKEADLGLREKPSTVLSTTDSVEEKYNSYFVDAVIEDVIEGLMETKNYSYEYAESQLYKGGFKIYTTVDLDVQKKLEAVFKDDSNFLKVTSKSGAKPQAAMTIMDYKGHIVGIVGGRGEKTGNRVLNRATQSPRQPGSSIKPVTCYAPAIEFNLITYGSRMQDTPITKLENGVKVSRWPKNYTGYYAGEVSVLYALEQSMNTIPVKLAQQMTLRKSFDFATQRMGLSTLVESVEVNGQVLSDIGESALALGGGVYGVTTRDLTAAYATFGNLGYYWRPRTYTKVLDQKNEVVLQQEEKPKIAMSEDTANVMCEMLQRVTKYGTGTPAAFGGWPIMSKTGTTSDTKDRWFVGGTPYYVAAVWFGLDNNEAMGGLYTNPALKLWKAVMQPIHKGLKLKDFPESDTCEYRKYCTDSGKVATSGCKNTSYGWFKASYQPICDEHYGQKLDAVTKPKPVAPTTAAKTEKTTAASSTAKPTNAVTTTTTAVTQAPTQAPVIEPTTPVATEPPVQETTIAVDVTTVAVE
ncbi:MAG: penicillin-binding protein [Clostridia bacterium]|nr:penicillin-binding protein [Clostridia bacterium]